MYRRLLAFAVVSILITGSSAGLAGAASQYGGVIPVGDLQQLGIAVHPRASLSSPAVDSVSAVKVAQDVLGVKMVPTSVDDVSITLPNGSTRDAWVVVTVGGRSLVGLGPCCSPPTLTTIYTLFVVDDTTAAPLMSLTGGHQ